MKAMNRSVLFYQEGVVPSGVVGGDGEDGRGRDNCGRCSKSNFEVLTHYCYQAIVVGGVGCPAKELIVTSDKAGFVVITNDERHPGLCSATV